MLRDVVARGRRRRRGSARLGTTRRPADELLVGIADIARAAGVDERTVWRWADPDGCDPLRIEFLHGVPRIRRSVLRSWDLRRLKSPREKKVRGWAAICERAEMSRSAAWRASRPALPDRLPVFFAEGERPWAYASALDDWTRARLFSVRVHRDRVRALRLAQGLLEAPPAVPGAAPASGAQRVSQRAVRCGRRAA